MTLLEIQTELKARGYYSGKLDSDWGGLSERGAKEFQAAHGLKVTGRPDATLIAALSIPRPVGAVVRGGVELGVVPATWLPRVTMSRIHFHWTGGAYTASANDRSHYHVLVDGSASLVRGTPSIALNVAPVKPGYAAHTLNANGDAIAVSVCCMGGKDVSESPFRAGAYPMKRAQFDMMARAGADLCRFYDIPVGPKTTLSHAEVGANLGIPQRGKWDFTRLPFEPSLVGAKACGDALRAAISAHLRA